MAVLFFVCAACELGLHIFAGDAGGGFFYQAVGDGLVDARAEAVQIQSGQEYVALVVLFNGGKRRGENLGERAAFLPDGLTRCAKINQHGDLVFGDKDVFGFDVAVQKLPIVNVFEPL